MRVLRWGDSLAIRLPAAVVDAMELREGDEVALQVVSKCVIEIGKAPGAKKHLASLRRFRGRLPNDFKFDRWEANQRR